MPLLDLKKIDLRLASRTKAEKEKSHAKTQRFGDIHHKDTKDTKVGSQDFNLEPV